MDSETKVISTRWVYFLTLALTVIGLALVMACGGSSGHTVPGAPDGDSVYRDLVYEGCETEDLTLDDGTEMTQDQCRCMMDLGADAAGSYQAFLERTNSGTMSGSELAFSNFGGVLACMNR